jgi:hypothetical protein
VDEATGKREGRLGERLARVLMKWAALEEREQNLPMAAWLAFRAAFHLKGTGHPAELHAAYALLLRLQRRRLEYGQARQALAGLRDLNLPTSHPGERDARLDEFLIALEVTLGNSPSASAAVESLTKLATERLEEGPRRSLAIALAQALVNDDPTALAEAEIPKDGGRWEHRIGGLVALLRTAPKNTIAEATRAAIELAERVGPDEPELRRLAVRHALRRVMAKSGEITFDPQGDNGVKWVDTDDLLRLFDLRRAWTQGTRVPAKALAEAVGKDGALRMIEVIDHEALRLTVTARSVQLKHHSDVDAYGHFRDEVLAVRAQVQRRRPSWQRLLQRAQAAYAALRADLPSDTKRVFVSLGKPIGALPLELGSPADGSGPALWIVTSLGEFLRASERPLGSSVTSLDFQDSPLRGRHGLVALAPFDEKRLKGFRSEVDALLKVSPSMEDAVHNARGVARAKWKPQGPVRIPFWAAFMLRGAP